MDVMRARTSEAEQRRSKSNPAGKSMSIFCVGVKKKNKACARFFIFLPPPILLRSGIFFSSLLKVVMAGDDLQSGWRKEDEASQEPLCTLDGFLSELSGYEMQHYTRKSSVLHIFTHPSAQKILSSGETGER